MGRLILTMHTTADGYIATPDGQMWPAFGWPPEVQAIVNDLYRETAAVVYGRGIYEMVVPFWTQIARDGLPDDSPLGEVDLEFAQLMAALPMYVVTHGSQAGSIDEAHDGSTRATLITTDVVEEVRRLVDRADGHVLLLAGGTLAGELADAGVLDELFLLVGPVILGRGKPLLDVTAPHWSEVVSAQSVTPTCTIIRYAMRPEFPSGRS